MSTKFAVILGASRGIGQVVARVLAEQGYSLALVARDAAGLEETAKLCKTTGKIHILPHDVTSELETVRDSLTKITKTINVVWLGTAGFSDKPISELDVEEIRSLVRSGYDAIVEFICLTYPMLKAGSAHLIGACSDWSDFRSGGPSVFGSTKVALAGFLDKLRIEVAKDGIGVTALKMGNVGNLEGYGLDEVDRQIKETGCRMVSLADVAESVRFILTRKTGVVSELTIVPQES